MLSTVAELAPRGAQGWCVGPGVGPEMDATWQQSDVAARVYDGIIFSGVKFGVGTSTVL